MVPRIISDDVFLATTLDLFRTYGVEGVSLKQLADVTGLEKASLYCRYPGGKNAMAMAVYVVAWFQAHVFDHWLEAACTQALVVRRKQFTGVLCWRGKHLPDGFSLHSRRFRGTSTCSQDGDAG